MIAETVGQTFVKLNGPVLGPDVLGLDVLGFPDGVGGEVVWGDVDFVPHAVTAPRATTVNPAATAARSWNPASLRVSVIASQATARPCVLSPGRMPQTEGGGAPPKKVQCQLLVLKMGECV